MSQLLREWLVRGKLAWRGKEEGEGEREREANRRVTHQLMLYG